MMRRILHAVIALAASVVATADQQPNLARGFQADKTFSVHDVDNVNLFNGNLNVTIPVGAEYRVSSNLAYSLRLAYGGNVWDYEYTTETRQNSPGNPVTYEIHWSYPGARTNAGLGWMMTLGNMVSPGAVTSTTDLSTYQSPDGSEHVFEPTLHAGGSVVAGVSYTRDGTYIRKKRIVEQNNTVWYKLEFPDGTIREFRADGTLRKIADRFGNFVTSEVSTDAPPPDPAVCGSDGDYRAVRIADSTGRDHYLYYRLNGIPSDQQPFGERLCQAKLRAFSAADDDVRYADYKLHYADKTISRQYVDTELSPSVGTTVTVPLLTRLELPESAGSYRMVYDIGMRDGQGLDSNSTPIPNQTSALTAGLNPGSYTGHLRELQAPTLGTYKWEYTRYTFPRADDAGDPSVPADESYRSYAAGVKSRTMVGAAITSIWQYAQGQQYTALGKQVGSYTTVTDLADGATTAYFSACHDCPAGYFADDYGLPFTRYPAGQNSSGGPNPIDTTLFLSTQTAAGDYKRSAYVSYESGFSVKQVKERKTVVKHGAVTESSSEKNENFDGMGHYRTTRRTGFGTAVTRVQTTNYNSGFGPSSVIQSTADWLPGMFDYTETRDILNGTTQATTRTEYCWDPATAFLLGRRVGRGATDGATDLLTIYQDEPAGSGVKDGNVSIERFYGGDRRKADDPPPIPESFASCNGDRTLLATAYELEHEYAYGIRNKSKYVSATFPIVDGDIEAAGLPRTTRDASGFATSYDYDLLGRIKNVKPAVGGWTLYEYSAATSTTKASVKARQCAQTSTTCASPLTDSRYYFDAFGRLIQERRAMPVTSHPWSVIETTYDAAGRKATVSVPQGAASGNYSAIATDANKTTWSYDVLGRITAVTQPDSSVAEMRYVAASVIARSAKIRTIGTTDSTVWTKETSDAFGRLIRVDEDSDDPSSGALSPDAITTTYEYDEGDRLVKVIAGSGDDLQTRTFDYDPAGLLGSEKHPENGTTAYAYDARGHAITRTVPGDTAGSADKLKLQFTYDAFERIVQVDDTTTPTTVPLKKFTYDEGHSETNRSRGRMTSASRHNYQVVLGGEIVVKEIYTFDNAGRMVTKKTETTGRPTFTDTYTYDDLGNMKTVAYPSCTSCGSPPSRTVTSTFDDGLPLAVTGYATFGYLTNGLLSTIQHLNPVGNGPLWTQTGDSFGMGRPGSIDVTGYCPDFAVTSPQSKAIILGEPADLTVSAPGATHYAWYIDGQSTPLSGETGATLNHVPTATTRYWVRASNGTCSVDSAVATVTVNQCAAPDASFPALTINRGGTATVTANSASKTYEWIISAGGTITSGASARTVTVRSDCGGAFSISLKVTASCGTHASTSQTITPVTPTVTATATTPISQGGSSTLTATIPQTGPWTVGWAHRGDTQALVNGAASVSVTPSGTTAYTIATVNGCSGSFPSVTVTVVPPAPLTLTAAGSSASVVQLSWTIGGSADVDQYRIERCGSACAAAGASWSFVGSTAQTSFADTTAAADNVYAYRVRSVKSGTQSASSPIDIATTIVFTDDPLLAGVTTAQATHLVELRTAAEALRVTAGLTPFTYADAVATELIIQATHVGELRSSIAAARTQLGLAAVAFTDPSLGAGGTVKAIHWNQLRGGVR
jgi:YD repeat-containing protein